jgi:hypothetical protein
VRQLFEEVSGEAAFASVPEPFAPAGFADPDGSDGPEVLAGAFGSGLVATAGLVTAAFAVAAVDSVFAGAFGSGFEAAAVGAAAEVVGFEAVGFDVAAFGSAADVVGFEAVGFVGAAFGSAAEVVGFEAVGFDVAAFGSAADALGFEAVGFDVAAFGSAADALGFVVAAFAFAAGFGFDAVGPVVAAAVDFAARPAAPPFDGGFGFVREAGLGFVVVAEAFAFAAVPAAPPLAGALGLARVRVGAVPEWNPPGSPGLGAPEVASRPRAGAGRAAVPEARVRAVWVGPAAAPVLVPPARGASAGSVVGVTVISESS